MTIDYHLLGDTDERLVTKAREAAFDIECGLTIKQHVIGEILRDLIERVYLLHERTEELDESQRVADDATSAADDFRKAIASAVSSLDELGLSKLADEAEGSSLQEALDVVVDVRCTLRDIL